MSVVLAVDGGQTEVRAGLFARGERLHLEQLRGLQYGEAGDDVRTIMALLDLLAERLPASGVIDTVVLALTGMPSDADTRSEIGAAVYQRFDARRVTVATDVPAAYLGALGARPGAVISAGSGAVAFAVDGTGRTGLGGGGGALLGDDGSGYWIGHQALREAWRVHTGRPGSRSLYERARRRYGPLELLPRTLRTSDTRVGDVANFAPDVAAAAADGVPAARDILLRAGRHLAETLAAAVTAVFDEPDDTGTNPVAQSITASWNGRLLDEPTLRAAFIKQLAAVAPALTLTPPIGSALDGAYLLGQLEDLTMLGRQVSAIRDDRSRAPARPEGGR